MLRILQLFKVNLNMRKFLPIFLLIFVAFVCCEESEETLNLSSETRVKSFTFYEDTVNPGLTEATYKIDHSTDTGLIYCVDSLRYGTCLDSVRPHVSYMITPSSAKFIVAGDTVVSTGADTINFNKKPIYLLVEAADMEHTRLYRFEINVHTADPNLYVWKQLTDKIFAPQICETKAFYMGGTIYLFVNNGFSTTIYQSLDGALWKEAPAPIGLPTPCHVRDILQHGETLYYIADNKLYQSTNLTEWTSNDFSASDFALVNMLFSFDNKAWCILQNPDTEELFLGTVAGNEIHPVKNIFGLTNDILPSNFPVSDFAALSFHSTSERPRAMVVGGRTIDGTAVNTRWNIEYESSAGYRLVDFSIAQPSFNTLTGAAIIQYNNHLIMFGGIDNDLTWRSDILYSDDEGMNWYLPDTASNQLPESYVSRQNPSVIVDNQQNIFIIGGQSLTSSYSDVYRGYLNELKWGTANE